MSRPRALVLTGSLGLGHHVVTEVVADSLEQMGWSTGVFVTGFGVYLTIKGANTG